MKHYPLIFGPIGGLVAGNGFIARVQIRGRCLLEETDTNFYSVLGVNPGAVAGDGDTISEAHHSFLEGVRLNVFETASEASDFDEFKVLVERFVRQTNRPNEALWRAAVERVRAGEVDIEGVRREDADGEAWVLVELVARDERDDDTPRQPLMASLNEPAVAQEDFMLAVA